MINASSWQYIYHNGPAALYTGYAWSELHLILPLMTVCLVSWQAVHMLLKECMQTAQHMLPMHDVLSCY
jgi:hypothetical protein